MTGASAEVAHMAGMLRWLAWNHMFGALVLAVSLVPYFFSTDLCWGWEIQDSFSMSRVYTGMSGSVGAAVHLSLSPYALPHG